jgi:hypothetical protein
MIEFDFKKANLLKNLWDNIFLYAKINSATTIII